MAIDNAEVVPTTQPTCAARDNNGDACHGVPYIPCPKCLLVAYCDPACRERHWARHKRDRTMDLSTLVTKRWDEEAPAKPTSFWSSYAATDVLNLEKNEGRYFDDRLNLLFTGESGLRHFIYTVAKLPESASPDLGVYLNETGHLRLVRTYYALQLLFAHEHDPVLNAEAVIHMWYSARMPKALHDHIRSVVKNALVGLHDELREEEADDEDEPRYYRSHWASRNISMAAELGKSQWAAIKGHLDVSTKVGMSEALVVRYLDLRKHCISPGKAILRMTRSRTLGLKRWQDDGILLPYGHPRDGFDTPNPIFFHTNEAYPAGASAEPLSEWPMELLDYRDCPAPNDVYGKMFYYLRDLLVRFQRRAAEIPLYVQLTCQTAARLPDWDPTVQFDRNFDRIEVGDYWDLHPFLTLVTFARLLRHRDENPFATLLTMCRDSVTHDMDCVREDLESEEQYLYRSCDTVLDEYAPPVADEKGTAESLILRRRIGLLVWRNWDKFSSRFLYSPRHFAFASLKDPDTMDEHRSVIQTGFVGLSLREKHIITRRWPNRLVHSKKDRPSLRDFNRWLGWPNMQPERWLEWKRDGDFPDSEWHRWMRLAASMTHMTLMQPLRAIIAGPQSNNEGQDLAGGVSGRALANRDDNSVDGSDASLESSETKETETAKKGKGKKKKTKKTKNRKK